MKKNIIIICLSCLVAVLAILFFLREGFGTKNYPKYIEYNGTYLNSKEDIMVYDRQFSDMEAFEVDEELALLIGNNVLLKIIGQDIWRIYDTLNVTYTKDGTCFYVSATVKDSVNSAMIFEVVPHVVIDRKTGEVVSIGR